MTLFWILALALVAAVLVALLRPLLRGGAPAAAPLDTAASNLRILRDQLAELDAERAAGAISSERHRQARDELERRVLEESKLDDTHGATGRARRSALALGLALPLLALGLYLPLGNLDALDPILSQPADQIDAQDVEVLVQRLADRMAQHPDDPEGWALLGRAYASMQRFGPARDALAQAVARRGDDAQLRADYADMLAMTQDRDLRGEPERQIALALKSDPDNLKALALAGSAAMQRGDFDAAIAHWTRARTVAGADSAFAQGIAASLAEAYARAGRPLPASLAASGATAEAPPRVIDGQVRLAPALAARVQPGDTLFVFARAVDGPPAPLAVQRGTVGTWPVAFTLDDTMAMSPALRLSAFDRVVVVARISRSGQALPQPGDLEGTSAPVGAGSGPVDIVIDRVLP